MKKLALKHAFLLARIIKAANVRNEIVAFGYEVRERQKAAQEAAQRAAEENAEGAGENTAAELEVEKVGFEFFVTLITAAADEGVEKKIYQLYADLKGVTPGEVEEYDFKTVKADLKELIEENDLKSFFNSVSALMSK